MISRRILTVLLAIGCVAPVAIAIVVGVARLLGAMDDAAGALALERVALALGIVWAISLVCLLLALAINVLGPPEH
ncbi:MAG: hypothetical protein WD845_11195 [Pirellulales bacterium]